MWDEQEFKIGDVRFRVGKMPALKAFNLLEYMRKVVADRDETAGIDPGNGTIAMVMLVKAIAGLPTDAVEHIRRELFPCVQYWTPNVHGGSGIELLTDDDVDAAFATLEPIKIYELIVRCLAVNFTGSFAAILSDFPLAAEILKQFRVPTSPTI